MIKKLLIGVITLSALNSNSQTSGVVSNVAWKQFFSERTNIANLPSAIDAGNNVYITGYTYPTSPSNPDATTVKYDAAGTFQFSVNYDNGGVDNSKAIITDATGNFYITGESDGTGTGRDVFTAKYSSAGVLIWVKRFNGTGNANDVGNAITLDPSGNVFVTGYTTNSSGNRDYVTIGYNSGGTQLFAVTFAGAGNANDEAVSLAFSNNRLFVTGTSVNASGNSDLVTLRLNPTTGATVWTKSENGTANSNDVANAIIADGNDVLVVGSISNITTGNDYITAKYNGNNGNTLFNKQYDFINSNNIATALVKDALGNYAVTGISLNGTIYEYHTIFYNNSGVQQWVNKVSTGLTYSSAMPQIATDPIANHFYVCGQKQGVSSDIFVYQITPGGNKTWEELVNGAQNGQDAAVDLVVNSTGDIYVAGASLNSTAKFDYATIKINQTPVYFPIDFNNANEPFANNHYFYPNNGEIIQPNGIVASQVLFYKHNVYPQQYILADNKLAFITTYNDTTILNKDSISRVDLEFIKSNKNTRAVPFDYQDNGLLNYFLTYLGNTPITDVKGSTRLMIPNIYPNIDLHYYSNSSGLKMYFVVKPGGSPNSIEMNFNGASSTAINGSNGLNINTSLGSFKFTKPQVYNVNSPTTTQTVTGVTGWVNTTGNTYKVSTGTYNNALPLVIQINQGTSVTTSSLQNINWSTYYGGDYGDYVYKTKTDASNNLFVSGETIRSSLFPPAPITTTYNPPGGYDAFINKFNPSGKLLWTTFVGGNATEKIYDFDFTATDIYCVGATGSYSPGLPTSTKFGAFNKSSFSSWGDGFIFQTDNATGSLNKWCTYYGGDGVDELRNCKISPAGDLFVSGVSTSTDIPVVASGGQYSQTYNPSQIYIPMGVFVNSTYDGILMKFSSSTSALNWATYYGTSSVTLLPHPNDEIRGIEINGTNLYICGSTMGVDLPSKNNNKNTAAGNYEGFVANFNTNGNLLASRYSGNINNYAIKFNNNKVYTCGNSYPILPIANSGSYYYKATCSGSTDGNLTVYSSNIQNVIHSTYIGGGSSDELIDIQFNSNGVFYLLGTTNSSAIPPVAQPTGSYFYIYNGNNDYFLQAHKENTTSFIWNTFFGSPDGEGSFNTDGIPLAALALDNTNNLYICGGTDSYNFFPLDNGGGPPTYFQSTCGGNPLGSVYDATITKFNLAPINAVIGIYENNKLPNTVTIYPNPTSNYLTIKQEKEFNDIVKYEIYNIDGKKLIEGNFKNTENNINVSDLPFGFYLINFVTDKGSFTSKFIKASN